MGWSLHCAFHDPINGVCWDLSFGPNWYYPVIIGLVILGIMIFLKSQDMTWKDLFDMIRGK